MARPKLPAQVPDEQPEILAKPRRTNNATKAKPTAVRKFLIPQLNLQTIEVVLVGDTPLVCHNWSNKAKLEMYSKQTKKPQLARAAKDPDQELEDSLYQMSSGGYGFPSVAMKCAAVTAYLSVAGVKKVEVQQAFRVVGSIELVKGVHPGSTLRKDLVRIYGSKPGMSEEMVRLNGKTADLRYRGEFWPWYIKVQIVFNANLLSADQIINLLNTAGFGVGIGEHRPVKNGQQGTFHVCSSEEMARLTEEGVFDVQQERVQVDKRGKPKRL